MITDLLKAFAIGVCASVPIGPTAILVLQKTLSGGRKVGFTTALGATVVDTTYSAIAIFAVSTVFAFIESHQSIFLLAGGVIVSIVGIRMAYSKVKVECEGNISAGNTLSAMLCALANPGAIAAMLALVALFHIDVESVPVWALAPCVALGSISYWLVFTKVFSQVKNKVGIHTLEKINRVAGIVVILLGIVLIIKGIINL